MSFPMCSRTSVRQVDRQVRRVGALLQVGDLGRPPADVDVGEDHAPAADEQRALVGRHVDRDRGQDVRVEHDVVRARAGQVELRPHRRVLELELIARVTLRENAARALDERGGIRERARSGRERRRAVVVERELRRCQRCRKHVLAAERQAANVHDDRRDIRLDRGRAGRPRTRIRIGPDHVVAVGDSVVRVQGASEPVRYGPGSRQHLGAAVDRGRQRLQLRVTDRLSLRRCATASRRRDPNSQNSRSETDHQAELAMKSQDPLPWSSDTTPA